MRLSLTIYYFIILAACKSTSAVTSITNLTGQYISADTKLEKISILNLSADSTFTYFYMLGGCQDKVNGKWAIRNNNIFLTSSVHNDSISYFVPALNKISWAITKKGIKPEKPIDNGCFKESSLHKKTIK